MNRLFEIQTLSANQVSKKYNPNKYYLPHGYEMKLRKRSLADPITVITGIATIIPSLFPNMFGTEKLTMEHLNKLFPGNGFYTTQYKNWLLQKIKYLKDVERDLHMYTGQFIEANQDVFCKGGTGTCWQGFYKILEQESITGGKSPVGNIYGSGFDFQTIALIGGGVILLALLTKKKKSKK